MWHGYTVQKRASSSGCSAPFHQLEKLGEAVANHAQLASLQQSPWPAAAAPSSCTQSAQGGSRLRIRYAMSQPLRRGEGLRDDQPPAFVRGNVYGAKAGAAADGRLAGSNCLSGAPRQVARRPRNGRLRRSPWRAQLRWRGLGDWIRRLFLERNLLPTTARRPAPAGTRARPVAGAGL